MTIIGRRATIRAMAKPGRRQGTPTQWRTAFIRATRRAREDQNHPLTQTQMAAELSRRAKREISYDTYRKWENEGVGGAMLPHDLIIYFCDITEIHVLKLLSPSMATQIRGAANPKGRDSSRIATS